MTTEISSNSYMFCWLPWLHLATPTGYPPEVDYGVDKEPRESSVLLRQCSTTVYSSTLAFSLLLLLLLQSMGGGLIGLNGAYAEAIPA